MRRTRRRAEALYREHRALLHRRVDLMFAVLMLLQFVAGVVAALTIAPRTWAGPASETHLHVWAALGLGACLTSVPVLLVVFRRGERITRYTIAVAQMLFSALLIHLSGGRIETHFHVFGSLAFLACYRDWKVLFPATAVIATDHIVRGVFWPESVFGVLVASPWRAFEHAGWVLFEDAFLAITCVQGAREMRSIARTRARLERSRERTEAEIERRTEQLRASEERFHLAIAGSRDGLWDWDLRTNTVYYAPRWKELLGLRDDEVSDSPEEWFGRIASGNLSDFHAEMMRHVEGETDRFDMEVGMTHADGEARWMLCRAAAKRDGDGTAVRLAGSMTDITELKRTQEELRRLAQHDRLTGLPNRELFTDRLRAALARARRDKRRRFAVLFFDFDRFKVVNDSLGHNVGDALLVSIAERFRAALRDGDTAARFGGDEFVVLLDNVRSRDEVEGACRRLLDAFAKPHEVEGVSVVSTASIGVVTSDLGHDDAEDMIRDADAAMYQAKMDGKARRRFFDEGMHQQAIARLRLEQDLRVEGVERGYRLLYQPIVSLETGEVAGFEALMRWQHPQRGLLSPDQFITIAEETGDIVPMGEWAVREAIAELARLKARTGGRALYMNINLSKRQLIHPSLGETLGGAIEAHGVDPSEICLEITETTVMDERHDMTKLMWRIREMGVRLAMDDFGTGHSSLSCLHCFPIDVLKVDRSFIWNIEKRREFTAVLNAIVTLAHHLNLTVVAEGVETTDQLAQLQGMDCDTAQGYLFSKPVDAEAAAALLSGRFGDAMAA